MDHVAEDDAVAEEELFGPGFGEVFLGEPTVRVIQIRPWVLHSSFESLRTRGA